jgi:hypothetical protein
MESRSKDAQMMFGNRYGNFAKRPVELKTDGKLRAGSAKYPPIEGPIIVPILHTNGMTAYAFALLWSAQG